MCLSCVWYLEYLKGREAVWNKREDEVSCRSHQAEMNSTFQSGNIRLKLGKGERGSREWGKRTQKLDKEQKLNPTK